MADKHGKFGGINGGLRGRLKAETGMARKIFSLTLEFSI
jgi:hypothetical protein